MEIGETLPMLAALQRGDVDVTPEVWPGQIEGAWKKPWLRARCWASAMCSRRAKAGTCRAIPSNATPTSGGPPTCNATRAPSPIRKIPPKGRIYGCPAGWACGTLNENLLKALQLEHDYNLFAPGSGAAQKAAIMSAYKRKRDIVFYYWTPTALVGALDLVSCNCRRSTRPPTCMTDPRCAKPVPTEFKPNPVVTGLNADFARQAPALHRFFEALTVPDEAIGATLGWLENEKAEADDAALYFLRQYGDVWKKWVPADVAQLVQAAL